MKNFSKPIFFLVFYTSIFYCNSGYTYKQSEDDGHENVVETTNSSDVTNSSKYCKLHLLDNSESFKEIILQHRRDGIGLIFFKFIFDDELSDAVKDDMINPLSWISASKNFGTNVLLMKDLYPFFIYKYIQLGILEDRVRIRASPRGCLKLVTVQEYTEIVLNLIFDVNSTTENIFKEDGICTASSRTRKLYTGVMILEFYYECYNMIADKNIAKKELKTSLYMNIFQWFIQCIYASFFILLIFIATLKLSLSHEKAFLVNLKGDRKRYKTSLINVQDDFIAKREESFKLFTWLYNNLFKCHVRQSESESVGECCDAPVLFCCKKFSWFNCCRKLMCILLFFCSFIIPIPRILLYFYSHDEDHESRKAYASRKGYQIEDTNATSVVLFIFAAVSIMICFVLLIDIMTVNKIMNYRLSLFKKSLTKSQVVDGIRKSWRSFFWPYRKLGIFGFFLLPISVFFLLVLIALKTPFRFFALCQQPKKCKSVCKILCFFFAVMPVFAAYSDMFTIIFTNLSFCIIIALMNYGTYLKYLVFAVASIFYVTECFTIMTRKYHSFHRYLNQYFRENTDLSSFRECNTCVFLTTDQKNLRLHLSKSDNNGKSDYILQIKGGFPIAINDKNGVLLSRSFFLKTIAMDEKSKGFPGSPISNCLSTLCHLFGILVFLFFVLVVILNFGDEYFGSDITQALAVLVSSLLPWVVQRKISLKYDDEFDIDDPEFQYILREIISSHDQTLLLKRIEETIEGNSRDEVHGDVDLDNVEINVLSETERSHVLEISTVVTCKQARKHF